jgi:hypothetical protein
MTVCASSTESNASTESTSSRTREPNDSTNGFCQGEPGSMKLRPLPPSRHQSRRALAVISGPLSIRTSSGAVPRSRTIWSSTPTAWSASIEAGDADRERLAGVLVDDVQQLQGAAVDGCVELEVDRPDVVGSPGPQPRGRDGRVAEPEPLPLALRHAQALFAPQPLDLLAVHGPALLADGAPGEPVAPTRMLGRQLPQPLPQRVVALAAATTIVALGRAVLTRDPPRPPLRQSEPFDDHPNGIASAGRAQKFPFAISFSAWFSSS